MVENENIQRRQDEGRNSAFHNVYRQISSLPDIKTPRLALVVVLIMMEIANIKLFGGEQIEPMS
jgi:hypothetical protein